MPTGSGAAVQAPEVEREAPLRAPARHGAQCIAAAGTDIEQRQAAQPLPAHQAIQQASFSALIAAWQAGPNEMRGRVA